MDDIDVALKTSSSASTPVSAGGNLGNVEFTGGTAGQAGTTSGLMVPWWGWVIGAAVVMGVGWIFFRGKK